MLSLLQKIWPPLLLAIAALMMTYPFLHGFATWRAWNTPDLPEDWTLNLGIALFVGALGLLLWGPAWRALRNAYSTASYTTHR
jgi:hypothetical protein